MRAMKTQRTPLRVVVVTLLLTPMAAAQPSAQTAPSGSGDAWTSVIRRGDQEGRGITQESRELEEALRPRRALREHVRVVLYADLALNLNGDLYLSDESVPRTDYGSILVSEGLGASGGLGVGLRYTLSDRWDFQTRARFGLVQQSFRSYRDDPADTSNLDGLKMLLQFDIGVRVRGSLRSNWYFGFGLTSAYGMVNASGPVIWAASTFGTPRESTRQDYIGSSSYFSAGPYLEVGTVFGAREQWDLGLRLGGGPSGPDKGYSVDASLVLGWAVW